VTPIQDIRWQQRLASYKQALRKLDSAVTLVRQRQLSELENQGLIQAFEFTYELAWNVLKDYLVWQGIEGITGSRDTIREAFTRELITEGEIWMQMLVDRNRSIHTYNEKVANAILKNISAAYIQQFRQLEKTFDRLINRG